LAGCWTIRAAHENGVVSIFTDNFQVDGGVHAGTR
jgi:hypothetical protein